MQGLRESSPATMRCASPSTTAVLPGAAYIMRTGVVFVRRLRRTTRRISLSSTGSNEPSSASREINAELLQRLNVALRIGGGYAELQTAELLPSARRGAHRGLHPAPPAQT